MGCLAWVPPPEFLSAHTVFVDAGGSHLKEPARLSCAAPRAPNRTYCKPTKGEVRRTHCFRTAYQPSRLHADTHVRPTSCQESYRTSSRSKRTSPALSPRMAWNVSSGSFVCWELHIGAGRGGPRPPAPRPMWRRSAAQRRTAFGKLMSVANRHKGAVAPLARDGDQVARTDES
jgi:hypothetical protein